MRDWAEIQPQHPTAGKQARESWQAALDMEGIEPETIEEARMSLARLLLASGDEAAIEAALADLPPEARESRTPTAEELATTYPPGYRGDPAAEAERRPGSDT